MLSLKFYFFIFKFAPFSFFLLLVNKYWFAPFSFFLLLVNKYWFAPFSEELRICFLLFWEFGEFEIENFFGFF